MISPSFPADRTVTVSIGAVPPDRLDKALARDVPEEAALSLDIAESAEHLVAQIEQHLNLDHA
jgi:hypothetical protein